LDIDKNTIVSNFIIKDKSVQQTLDSAKKEYFVKFVVGNFRESRSEYVQLNFNQGFSNPALRESKQLYSDGKSRVFANGENIDGELFYGVLEFLLNNKPTRLMGVLQRIDSKISMNRNLVNSSKLNLLKKYKKYLEDVKEDKEDTSSNNPLRSSSVEEQAAIDEIYSQKLILRDDQIKRIKLGDEFYWIVDNENIFIKFSSDHQIKELNLRTPQGEVELLFGDYVVFGANLKFPEFIIFKTSLGKTYEIKPTKYSMFDENLEAHSKRKQRYQKTINTNNHEPSLFWPEFLM
jgi:hypothetical protein